MENQTELAVPVSVPSVFPGRQWQQVLERDAQADGVFVYAVKSTKVYCKPSCVSRRPNRKNVSFFPTPAAAEAAGIGRVCGVSRTGWRLRPMRRRGLSRL